MKKMKKLASLLLVLVMSLALTVPAFAATRESYYSYDSNNSWASGAGYNYRMFSTFYLGINSSSRYAAVWVREDSNQIIPSGYVTARAILCDSAGDSFIEGVVKVAMAETYLSRHQLEPLAIQRHVALLVM